jgi:hypothetical protein
MGFFSPSRRDDIDDFVVIPFTTEDPNRNGTSRDFDSPLLNNAMLQIVPPGRREKPIPSGWREKIPRIGAD